MFGDAKSFPRAIGDCKLQGRIIHEEKYPSIFLKSLNRAQYCMYYPLRISYNTRDLSEVLKIEKYLSDVPQFKPIKHEREYLMDCKPGNILSLADLNNQSSC